jgi:gliding motility-associated-like protein
MKKKGYIKISALFALLLLSLLQANAQQRVIKEKSAQIPIERIKSECKFFGGDTLSGFPMEATIEEGIKKFDLYFELKWYLNVKEHAFVKSKYHLHSMPSAEDAMTHSRVHVNRTASASCNNIDFESGTFSGWIGEIGYNANSNSPLTNTAAGINTAGINAAETGCSFHTLMTAAGGVDPWGGFPVLDPGGGSYSVRLGGENINTNNYVPPGCTITYPSGIPYYYSNGESIEQTFAVTPNNTLLTYNYAVVLEAAPHPNGQQPYFKVEVLDQSNNEIPCLNYYVQGDSAGNYPAGFQLDQSGSAYYLNWQTSSLNLLPYLGTNVTVRFTAAGCIPGGHFGYGYVDCSCAPLEIIIPTFACQGGIDSLIAPPVSGATFSWSGPGIVSGGSSQIITANAGGTYSVTITNSLGCSYVLDTTISFYPQPTVTVTSPSVCGGGTTTVTATSTGSAGTLTYSWSPSGGLSFSPGDSSATITPGASSTFTVTGTSVHGCTNTAVSNVTVNGSPAPTFNAPAVCVGQPSVFTNTTAGGITYHWDFGDGTTTQDTSSLQNPSYTYPSSGSYVASLTVTSNGGCISQGTQSVTVNPLPTATFSAPAVCLGNPTTISSNVTNGNTYTWDYGDGSAPAVGSANPSYTYTLANTYAVTLTVTSSSGCTVTATNSVTVNPLPVASFSVAQVCQGTGSAFANNSQLDATCAWNFGGAGNPASATTNCAVVNTFTYTAAGTYPVTLTVTSTAGCTASTSGSAVVNPFPKLNFTADHPCDGTAMNITNTTTSPGSITAWSWDYGDGTTSTTNPPPAHTYSASGCYSVALTATATTGCSGTFDTTVYIHPNPLPAFTGVDACFGTASQLIDASSVPNGNCLSDQITNWTWNYGDGTSSTATSGGTVSHTYASCGVYTVSLTLTTSNSCTATVNVPDTVFCLPVVTAPSNITVCPGTAITSAQTTFTATCASPSIATPHTLWTVNKPHPATITHTGIPVADTVGLDFIPTYNAIAQNLTCNLLVDTIYGIAITPVGNNPGCIGNVATFTISVYPTPFLSHMPNESICANQTLTVPSFTSCPAGATVNWTNSNSSIGLSASGTGNISPFTGTNTTDLPNTGQIDAVPTANGCVGIDSAFTIIIKPLPTMTVTSPPPYCPGDTVLSPAITTDPSSPAPVSYTWTATNNANIGMPASGTGIPGAYTAPSNTTLVNQTGVITYTPSLSGCIGTPATETITIKPTPYVNPVANYFYCPNQVTTPITFSCVPSGGVPIFTWSGLGGGGITQTGSVPSYTTVNTGPTSIVTTVTVNATLNNCQGPNTTFSITVYPNPVPKFTYSRTCDGGTMSFTDESVAGSGFAISGWQWYWNNSAATFSTQQSPQYNVSPAGWDTVTLMVKSNSVPSCSSAVKEPVFVNPNPVVDFSGISLKGCPNVNTAFTDLSTVTSGTIQSWNWSFGNGQTSTQHYPPPQIYTNTSPTTPAYYSVTLSVITDSGCVGTKTRNNYIEVYPKPRANFSWGPPDATLDEPTITFVNEAIGAATYSPTMQYGAYGVEYYLGDTYAPNNSLNYVFSNSSFQYTYNHNDFDDNYQYYNVTQWVINSYGCTDSITKTVEILPVVTFYIPNAFSPNGDGVNDGFKGTGVGIDNTTYNLWVFDRWGNQAFHTNNLEETWNGTVNEQMVQEDEYVWKVRFSDIFGKLHEYHGTVALIK